MTQSAFILNGFIEHTLLDSCASYADIELLCSQAQQWQFKAVCVNGFYIPTVASLLRNTSVITVATVGFPLGAGLAAVKVFEAQKAVLNGANEVDMVMALGALKAKDYPTVENDIKQVVASITPIPVKVIIECGRLTQDEKIIASKIVENAGASYIKTSTGFASLISANVDDILLIKSSISPHMKIKASGGIQTFDLACALIQAGADRIGSSRATSFTSLPNKINTES